MTQGIINPVNNVVLGVEMDEASHGELRGAAMATSLHGHLARPSDLIGETDRHL
jgi:hypothetical protein